MTHKRSALLTPSQRNRRNERARRRYARRKLRNGETYTPSKYTVKMPPEVDMSKIIRDTESFANETPLERRRRKGRERYAREAINTNGKYTSQAERERIKATEDIGIQRRLAEHFKRNPVTPGLKS